MNIRFETHGAVAVLTIDRQQALNALSVEALRELRTHLAEVRDRSELRAAIIPGAGERIAAAEAERIGLVTQVVEPQALMDRALALAQTVAANAPLAVQAIKKLSRQTQHLSEADAQQLTELYWGVLRDTHDRIEGRAAFAERRPPAYAGR